MLGNQKRSKPDIEWQFFSASPIKDLPFFLLSS